MVLVNMHSRNQDNIFGSHNQITIPSSALRCIKYFLSFNLQSPFRKYGRFLMGFTYGCLSHFLHINLFNVDIQLSGKFISPVRLSDDVESTVCCSNIALTNLDSPVNETLMKSTCRVAFMKIAEINEELQGVALRVKLVCAAYLLNMSGGGN